MGYSIEFFAALIGSGLIASFLLEGWLKSRPLFFWQRHWSCNIVHLAIYAIGFTILMLITQRVTVAVLLLFLGQIIIVAVNNTKEKTLHEPFLWCDFEYFTDAIRHPNLYLPFFGYFKAFVLISSLCGLFFWLIHIRIPITELMEHAQWVVVGELCILLVSILALGLVNGELPAPTLKATVDLQQMGLFAFIYAYRALEKDLKIEGKQPFEANPIGQNQSRDRDLVTIQTESFFDPRPLFPALREDLLPLWDQLQRESLLYGRLNSGPWGANTVRAEFEFLSGLSSAQIGVHQFQPYRKLARKGISTIASWLKSLGYRTIAIHPYQGIFYDREKIYPLLGFDELIDIESFAGASMAGGYVTDVALGEFVAKLLAKPSKQPRYIHVITMENHGPYQNAAGLEDTTSPLVSPLPVSCTELEIYARHLQHTDQLFGLVSEALKQQALPGGLCIFGDHVPIMTKAYDHLGLPDGRTNYLIWDAAQRQVHPGDNLKKNLRVESLALQFLKACAIETPKVR